jgi:MFS family permease
MTAATPPARPSALAIFRNRSFTLLWTAQLISSMGTALTSLAASIVVYRLTGSAFSVGLMMMAPGAPTLLVGLLAGVFVDRWDRKRIMIGADLLRAVLALLMPVLLPFGVGWLYALVIASSAITQFFDPAQDSVLPELAGDDELAAANSLMTISIIGATAVGYASAGLLAGTTSIAWAFYLDGLSFVVSALCIRLVRPVPRGAAARHLRISAGSCWCSAKRRASCAVGWQAPFWLRASYAPPRH